VELTPLRYFRAIAASGHMTRAAVRLGVTQPALSAAIRKLEEEVGAELLHRTGRGVELTEAGRTFVAFCEQSVASADAGVVAVRELLGLGRGSIRVGAGATASSYLLPPVVGAMHRARPGLKFSIREAGSSQVAAAVLAGELDLGIVTLPITLADADRLIRVPLVEDELRLIVPPEPVNTSARRSRKADTAPAGDGGDGFRWEELRGRPVVGFEAGTAVRELIDRAAAAAGVALDYVMELRSIESIKRMVAAGIGVGFVSRFALPTGDDFGPGRACGEGRLSRRLAIVRRVDRQASPAAAELEKQLLASVCGDRAIGSTGGDRRPRGSRS